MKIGRPRGGKNRYHSAEFKLEVVNRIVAGESSNKLAKEYDLSPGMVRRWVTNYKVSGTSALENRKKPGNPMGGFYRKKNITEIERLRFELAKAEVEIAKLKKVYELERSGAAQRK